VEPFVKELARILEALLFTSETPLTADELLGVLQQDLKLREEVSKARIAEALDVLQARYLAQEGAIELRKIAGGYQLLTRAAYAPYVKISAQLRENKKISRAAMETLSIIAYKQPVTKAEMEYIRGVSSEYALNKLLEKQLVEPAGRAELPGKPLLYRTTRYFLEHFGIDTVADLPRLQELKADEEAQAETYRTLELSAENNSVEGYADRQNLTEATETNDTAFEEAGDPATEEYAEAPAD